MIDRRLAIGCLLICIPALCASLATVGMSLRLRPVLEQQDRVRITSHYREVAERMQDDPTLGANGVLPSRRGRMRSIGKGRWGYVEDSRTAMVWYTIAGNAQVVTVPKAEDFAYGAVMTKMTIVALALFWLVTLAGCWQFSRSIKERDEFVAATAHDLKTPLAALRRLVGRDDHEAELVVERMCFLVQNLSDYLRLRGRPAKNEFKSFDLREAYDEAYRLFAEEFRWLNAGQDVSVSGLDKAMVFADRMKVQQILWNLLSNALKYGAPYGPVSVCFEADKRYVKFSVTDVGIGLSAYERHRVFSRYYRAKSVLKSGKGGFGIGLCTARTLARNLGGDITVKPNKRKGSVFTLTLRRSRS